MALARFRQWIVLAALALVVQLIAAPIAFGSRSSKAESPKNATERDVSAPNAAPVPAGFTAKGDNLIRLAAGAFDPLKSLAPSRIPALTAGELDAEAPSYWLVQTETGKASQAYSAISEAGGTVDSYIPDSTYLVRAKPAQITTIATSSAVRWTGSFQPGWKFPAASGKIPGLLDLSGTQTYKVYVYKTQPNPGAIKSAIAGIEGVTVLPDSSDRVFLVKGTATQIPAIAAYHRGRVDRDPGRRDRAQRQRSLGHRHRRP